MSYLNREYDVDDNDDGDDDDDDGDDDDWSLSIKKFKGAESFVKQAFFISFDWHCNGKNSFHFHLMNMSEYFKIPDFNPWFIRYSYGKKLCKFNETDIYFILAQHPSTFSKTWIL